MRSNSSEHVKISTLVLCLCALAYCLLPAAATATESDIDVPSSSDAPWLARYPRSHIVSFEKSADVLPYQLVLGSLREVNNVTSPKNAIPVTGKKTSITYRIPRGIRTEVVSSHFRDQLVSLGQILFECVGRNCGSSTYWANSVFGDARLYGPEQYQQLVTSKIARQEASYYVTAYTIQRGNRKVYVRLEIIDIGQSSTSAGPAVIGDLRRTGYVRFKHIDFDDNLIDSPEIIGLADLLKLEPDLKIYIVGHSESHGDIAAAISESTEKARRVAEVLTGLGIAEDRVTSYGIGPLAHLNNAQEQSIEIVLDR